MSKIKSSIRRFKYYLKHNFLSVENMVFCVAVIMCLVWTYQSVEAMSRNWALVDRLNTERRTLDLLNIEIEAAELENEYYKSDEYQELAARKYANKMLPGEKMIVFEEGNSEAAKTKHQKTTTEVAEEASKSNFRQWMTYLFP